MKKFIVKDELGEQYQIEEITEEAPAAGIETHDDESLTAEEIIALKKLAGMADEIVKLLAVEETEHAAGDPDPSLTDDNDEEYNSDGEEVIDTDIEEMIATKTARDSKKSLGSIETKQTNSNDQHELDVASAWAKRYGG